MTALPIETYLTGRETSQSLLPEQSREERSGMLDAIRPPRPAGKSQSPYDIACQILSFLPPGAWELDHEDSGVLRFAIQAGSDEWKLELVLFSRISLQHLEADPLRTIKIDYLQRDIRNAASHRRTYAYPHSALSFTTGS